MDRHLPLACLIMGTSCYRPSGYHSTILVDERSLGGKALWLDTHGVPIEYEIETKLAITGKSRKTKVLQLGIQKYNEEC